MIFEHRVVITLAETVGDEWTRKPVVRQQIVCPPWSLQTLKVDMRQRIIDRYGGSALKGSTTEVQVREVGEWETVRPELEQESLFQ